MNKIKSILFVAALLCGGLPASAQQTEGEEAKIDWRANWYIEAGVGTQLSFAKDAHRLTMGRRLTPSLSLTVGKWFSPNWGARLQFQGTRLHGFSTAEGLYLNDPQTDGSIFGRDDVVRDEVTVRPDGSYRYYLRYLNVHADVQMSLLNVLMGENEKRKFDVLPAVGIGYMHLSAYRGTPDNDVLSVNFSLMGKYRINKSFDINMELHSSVLPDHFDGRLTGKQYEPTLGLTIGATYRFKQRGFPKREVIRYVPQEVIRTVVDTVYVTKEVKVPAKVEPREPFSLAVVTFDINSHLPKKGQEQQFENIVKFLEKNPKAKVRLDGYADKATGKSDYNLRLSIRRASTVKQILMDDYKIDASRIEAQAIGDNAQPYVKDAHNRVVVMTIVEK